MQKLNSRFLLLKRFEGRCELPIRINRNSWGAKHAGRSIGVHCQTAVGPAMDQTPTNMYDDSLS